MAALVLITPTGAVAPAPAAKASAPSIDEIPLAGWDAAGVTAASAPEAWGGARTGHEATLADRVVSYQIRAKLDPVKHIVDGEEQLTWRNRSNRSISAVYLHLYLNAFEGYHSTFFSENRNLGFSFRTDVPIHDGEWGHIALTKVVQNGASVTSTYVHPDGGPEEDHTVVRLDLPTPVAPGASTTLDISFQDQLPRVVARTGYFGTFHLVGQWFPKIAVLELPGERGATATRWNAHEFHLHSEFYADYGNFDVHLTVPKGFVVGATGEETEAAVSEGDLVTHHFVQGDVHDFAWTADSRSAAPLEGTYNGPGSPPVKVRVIFPPEYEANAPAVLKATIDSLTFFSQTLGPYPYRTATAVVPPFNAGEAGGMEYPTFFTVEGFDKVTPGTILADALDFVTIHEFGHGYFYGILGSNEFEEPMLDEGLNEYWDMRMMRERNQPLHVTTPLLKSLGIEVDGSGFAFERSTAMTADPTDGTAANSWKRYSSGSYSSVYSRTATTMHDLEEMLGRPVMEKAFKEYYARWKFRHPSIADLRDTIADVSGKRELVDTIFAQQVYGARRVDDSVDQLKSEEELPLSGTHEKDGKWVDVKTEDVDASIEKARKEWHAAHKDAAPGTGPFPYRTTVVLRRHGAPMPQKLVVKFADGSSETVLWNDDARWARYTWVKPVKAVSAEIDPDHEIYLDTNKFNDSRTLEPNHGASLRLIGDFSAWLQTIYALIATL